MKRNKNKFKALGNSKATFTELETFPKPRGVEWVTCTSDEVTALCPATGQPDWYTVTIRYRPRGHCVESKTVKLYLGKFRNEGHFCEAFASIIAADFYEALDCFSCEVTVSQKPRGGVGIIATAGFPVVGIR